MSLLDFVAGLVALLVFVAVFGVVYYAGTRILRGLSRLDSRREIDREADNG